MVEGIAQALRRKRWIDNLMLILWVTFFIAPYRYASEYFTLFFFIRTLLSFCEWDYVVTLLQDNLVLTKIKKRFLLYEQIIEELKGRIRAWETRFRIVFETKETCRFLAEGWGEGCERGAYEESFHVYGEGRPSWGIACSEVGACELIGRRACKDYIWACPGKSVGDISLAGPQVIEGVHQYSIGWSI